MLKLKDVISSLESWAPLALQEAYDNSGLVTGDMDSEIDRCLVCLDVTPEVVEEAVQMDVPLIISHHPVIFKELKRISGKDLAGDVLIRAIRNGIALYSMHTNLDNISTGVNTILADKIGLVNQRILRPLKGQLVKLVTFCPVDYADRVREAIFDAGAGVIGNYDCCSYNIEGKGSFRANEKARPFVGEANQIHFEQEVRIETILPVYLEKAVTQAMISAHPYEEVAYDVYPLLNANPVSGAGMIGELPGDMAEGGFIRLIKKITGVPFVRHSGLLNKKICRVAVCGGSGSFLLEDAIRQKADVLVTSDIKYHQFFDPAGRILLIDAGHYETEQFTVELIARYLNDIFPNFAVHISKVSTNPVNYL